MNERLLKSSLDKAGLPCTGLSIDSSWSTNTSGSLAHTQSVLGIIYTIRPAQLWV